MAATMNKPQISVEFYPPQTDEGARKLSKVREQLRVLEPSFMSVTYGAGGSTQERSFSVIEEIAQENGNACAHLTCVGMTREKMRDIMALLKARDVNRIVALRGDPPSGFYGVGEFAHANDLVSFVRSETGQYFHIEVAAYPEYHPQARTPREDILAFKRKVDAGANSAITQYFFNPDAYRYYLDSVRKVGVNIPIMPGIMPIVSFFKLARFSEVCGAEIPRWMHRRFESLGDDTASIRELGLDIVTTLCERVLADGAPGLHFYTMNRADLVLEVCKRLGLTAPAPAPAPVPA